jgi:peptidyl-tRNA hydrolase
VRTDLEMTHGKMCSQIGHAFLGSFLQATLDIQEEYHKDFPSSPGTKIALQCPSLEHLLRFEELAKEAGLPFFRVVDSGCPNFFNGEPTITALGIGPARKDQIKHITKKLQLL